MSDWNSLENELRKWTPRQPSLKVRAQLFGGPNRGTTTSQVRFANITQWLVPAFGCFLLVIGTLSSRYPAHASISLSTNFLAQNGVAYKEMVIASGADHSDKNSLPVGPLEWSFGVRSTALELGTVPVSFTNRIIQ